MLTRPLRSMLHQVLTLTLTAQENIFLLPLGAGADLEWTIVRPGGLGLGPPTGEVRGLLKRLLVLFFGVRFALPVASRCTRRTMSHLSQRGLLSP